MKKFLSSISNMHQHAPETPPPLPNEVQRQKAVAECFDEASVMATYCYEMRDLISGAEFNLCWRNASDLFQGCNLIERDPQSSPSADQVNTYASLGISPDAEAIVLQPVIPGGQRPFFACRMSFAELDSLGRAAAIGKIGCMTLSAMKAFFAIISIFREELISESRGKPLAVIVPDYSGNIRDLHLRIHATIHEQKSVVIRRFNHAGATGDDTLALLLDTLMALKPEGATDLVGATLLAELVALHPDAFAPFPGLRGA